MGTFKEKIQDIKTKNSDFKKLKYEVHLLERNFLCTEPGPSMAYETEPFVEYDYSVEFPRACRNYDMLCPCQVKDCPHNQWNHQYIDLLNRFWVARRARNQAILNLFKIRKK